MGAAQSGTSPHPSWIRQQFHLAGAPTPEDLEYAYYAHLFAAVGNPLSAGLVIPVLCAAAPLLMTKSRHPFVLFHINQSAGYQLLLFLVNSILATVLTVVAFFTCGVGAVLFVLCAIPPLVGIIHPLVLAFRVREGGWDAYPVVGRFVMESAAKPLLG